MYGFEISLENQDWQTSLLCIRICNQILNIRYEILLNIINYNIYMQF